MQTESQVPTLFRDIPIDALTESTWNPRKHRDPARLDELAASIREKGVIEPIVVRANGTAGHYEILAGSRRFRASKLAGLAMVPAVVRDLSDRDALELAVVENLQREDVHPLDEAEGYKALLKADKAYGVAAVAAKVGKSESYIYRRLKLLDLEAGLQTALFEDRLSIAHAERLSRLTPDQRADAADPHSGVVWFESPLFAGEGEWVPQREDLRPLHELDAYIRRRTHFDPASRDVPHFQPELAAAIDEARQTELPSDQGDPATATLVELSIDPLARVKLGAQPGDPIPLTPSKWRAIKSPKDRCAHTLRGVVTHGGPTAVLEVCTKKSCAKHFPPAKKAKARATSKSAAAAAAERQASEEREAAKRKAAQAEWDALRPALCRAFAAHAAKLTVNAAFVRLVVDSWRLKNIVEQDFGVKLTDATALQALVLGRLQTHHRDSLVSQMQSFGFDVKAFTKTWKAERDDTGKAALKVSRETLKAKGKQAAPKKGGRK